MKKFLEIFENQTRFGHKIYVPQYLPVGKYPIVDQSKKMICGFYNDDYGLYTNVPCIIFGDVTREFKYIDFPCFLGADGAVILKVTNPAYDTKYMYYYLLTRNVPNTGYNRHYKFLKDLLFKEEKLAKQKKIVQILDSINEHISLEKVAITKYNEIVKSRFNEMFGDPIKNGKKYKTVPLSLLAPFNTVRNAAPISEHTWLLNLDMVESNTGRVISKMRTSKVDGSTCEFDTDCVLYSKLRPYLNKVVVPDEAGFCTSEMVVLRCNPASINRYFLASLLRHQSFVDYINSKTAGSKMPRASMDILRKFPVLLPDIQSQNAFASFVEKADKLKFNAQERIRLYQELLDKKMDEYFD